MGRRRPSKRTRRTAPSPSSSPVDSEPEGPDLIGALPDCVLHSILSLLPVKDAARTSVLSSHWTNLWKAAPLRLDDDSINPERHTRAHRCDPWGWSRNAVSRILDSHHGPIETFHLSRFAGGCNVLTMGRIVESAVRRPGGIQQVSLDCYGSELPLSLLHCNSLHQLSLYRCTFPPNLPPLIFPNLIKLQLKFVHIYKDLVQNLLSQCRSLETLHINACYFRNNHTSISISSPSLRELDCYKTHFRELIIKDAPNLVSLMCDKYGSDSNGTYYKVKVLHAPKLEQLGFLENFQQALPLGRTRIERQAAPGLQIEASPRQMKMLSSIRTLAIKMTQKSYCDKTVPDLLAYFPCLETLDILKCDGLRYRYDSDAGIWDEHGSLSFLNHLKTVTVLGFDGDQIDVEFLKYLVIHGKKLRKITLLCSKYITEKFVEIKRRQLCIEKRASSDLELVFLRDNEKNRHFSLCNKHFEMFISR